MINLFVLEDNKAEINILESYVLNWGTKKSKEINIQVVTSFENFISLEKTFGSYDGFFLDIELPDGSGMEAAKKLRNMGYITPIAFITSNDSLVFDGYDVSAIKYLLKPINQASIENLLNKLYGILPDKFYSFDSNGTTYNLKFKDIIYFESHGHYINIITKYYIYKHRKNISTLAKELDSDFCQSYRTIITNINYVTTIKNSAIHLKTGQSLPLGKSFENNFKKAYFKFQLSH